MDIRELIENGNTSLGIEFGSTRIKAVLIGADNAETIASGSHEWENQFVDGMWTYSLDAIWKGLQDCYQGLANDVKNKYGVTLRTTGSIGFSGMMHGYMAFDKNNEQLVPFRTWRNTITEEASEILSKAFDFNIPQRWSVAHLYQAILNGESHVKDIDFITTLAGYVHWKLTGKKVLGVGEASGMFPIDSTTKKFDIKMQSIFADMTSGKDMTSGNAMTSGKDMTSDNAMTSGKDITSDNAMTSRKDIPWRLEDILPSVLTAGENAGFLTEEGARLLDITGELMAGIPFCPPEGDAGTGMVATNSVAQRTGNVSAGTSVFAMIVLEKGLSKLYPEIDLVTTPSGSPVAMVHCNNCTSDLNAWMGIFKEFSDMLGTGADMEKLFALLYNKALEGDADGGGLLAYNYFSGEHITGFEKGCPLFVRTVDSKFNIANFMRTHLFTSLGALKIGLDILLKQEEVRVDKILGHGGLFKTKVVGQKVMAAAMNAPVSVMETAGEGGAWGMAVLASYAKNAQQGQDLETYLTENVFKGQEGITVLPDPNDVAGFNTFIERYRKGLPIERAAVDSL